MADNLPFQNPGKTLLGDARAQDLLPEAKRQMYLVKLFAETAGVQNYRRYTTFADGSRIIASTQAGIERVLIDAAPRPAEEEEEESSQKMNRLVWLPEGFVLTPKSVASPNGFGMPPTEDGLGTPGGPLKQVIVNRFVNNQYPDSVCEGIVGPQNPSVRTFCVAPLFFMDWEINDKDFGIGVWDGAEFLPQFSARWVPKYREPETGTWYCHRPMYALDAERTVHKVIREESNLNRTFVGRPEVGLPVRGYENGLAETYTFLMRDAKTLAHHSPKFRAGYRTAKQRFDFRFGLMGSSLGDYLPPPSNGESFVARWSSPPTAISSARLGKTFVDAWRDSPPHYANMIRDWGEAETKYGAIESAAYVVSGFTEQQLSPYYESGGPTAEYDPPKNGHAGTQIFHGMADFVVPSLVGQEGDYALGFTGRHSMQGHKYFPRFGLNTALGDLFVYFRGRGIKVFENNAAQGYLTITAAKMVVENGAATKLRVVGRWREAWGAGQTELDPAEQWVIVIEGDANDFWATRQQIGAFLLPDDIGQMSTSKFSTSGDRIVFSYTRAVSHDEVIGSARTVAEDLSDGTTSTATVNSARVWGETLHFVEFNGTSFSEILTQSLDVEVNRWVAGIHQRCVGEYKAFADYSGENVVYATAVINSETVQDGVGEAYTESVRLRGSLRFPNFTVIEYTHTDTAGAALEVSGFFRHFLYLDIMRPERTAYLQYDVQGTSMQSASMKLYVHGHLAKTKDNVLKPDPDPLYARRAIGFDTVGSAGLTAEVCSLSPYTSLRYDDRTDLIRINPANSSPAAAGTHKASLIPVPGFTVDAQVRGSNAFSAHTIVGPPVLQGVVGAKFTEASVGNGLEFSATFYKGEFLYAGYVSNSLRASMQDGDSGWVGEGRYFWYSSIPLREIVGMPYMSMHDNILPIGTL